MVNDTLIYEPSVSLREAEDSEFAGCSGVEVNLFDANLGAELLDALDDLFIMIHEDDDAVFCSDHRLWIEVDEILDLSMSQELDRLGRNRQSVFHHAAAAVRDDIFHRISRQAHSIHRHVPEILIESTMLIRVLIEEDKILGEVERSTEEESKCEERIEGNTATRECVAGFASEPGDRNERDEVDGHLGPDRSERMGQAFLSKEFWHEHDEKRREQEPVSDEPFIPELLAEAKPEKLHRFPDDEQEPGKEESSSHRIKDRIGWIVMAPILIAPEIVFHERKAEGFAESSPEIAFIDLG